MDQIIEKSYFLNLCILVIRLEENCISAENHGRKRVSSYRKHEESVFQVIESVKKACFKL